MAHTFLEKCGNMAAHIELAYLNGDYHSWQKTKENVKNDKLLQRLKYFETMGEWRKKPNPLDTKCKRFLLLVIRFLSHTENDFRIIYDNFWDTWGRIAGELLKKEDPNMAGIDDAKTVLHDLINDFNDNKWSNRKLTIKGFKTLVSNSIGYEDAIWDIFSYFLAYSEAACSGISRELPGPLCGYISWLVESFCKIAEGFSGRKTGIGHTSTFAPRLINSAGVIIEVIARADVSKHFDKGESIPNWREAMFGWMFPQAEIRQNINFQVITTENVKEAMRALIEKLDYLRKVPDYRKMSSIIDNLKRECEEIYQRIVVKLET